MTTRVTVFTLLLLASAVAAHAHVSISPPEAVATTSVELEVSEGVTIVTANGAAGSRRLGPVTRLMPAQ